MRINKRSTGNGHVYKYNAYFRKGKLYLYTTNRNKRNRCEI